MKSPEEDQATIAQELENPQDAQALLKRAQTDSILRKKIEAITGCELDPTSGRFTRVIPEAEYKTRFGFSGYEYYPKWSREGGEVTMDHIYWNRKAGLPYTD